jgi:hypothetical protein
MESAVLTDVIIQVKFIRYCKSRSGLSDFIYNHCAFDDINIYSLYGLFSKIAPPSMLDVYRRYLRSTKRACKLIHVTGLSCLKTIPTFEALSQYILEQGAINHITDILAVEYELNCIPQKIIDRYLQDRQHFTLDEAFAVWKDAGKCGLYWIVGRICPVDATTVIDVNWPCEFIFIFMPTRICKQCNFCEMQSRFLNVDTFYLVQ